MKYPCFPCMVGAANQHGAASIGEAETREEALALLRPHFIKGKRCHVWLKKTCTQYGSSPFPAEPGWYITGS